MGTPDHIKTVGELTSKFRMASRKPPGFTMQDVQRVILTQAGFRSAEPVSSGINCPLCQQRVVITPFGFVTTHQDGVKQCRFSNTNHFKKTIAKMRNDRWICLANTAKKKPKTKAGSSRRKKSSKNMTRQDRLIYATGRVSITSGGLPTLGRWR